VRPRQVEETTSRREKIFCRISAGRVRRRLVAVFVRVLGLGIIHDLQGQ
jgi:hypothetical protein